MQFKSLLALFALVMAVVAAPAVDDHSDFKKVDSKPANHKNVDDHSVKNDVDIKAEDKSSHDKTDKSCGKDQAAMCCDSFTKKDVNGLDLLLGQGCIAQIHALDCTNKAACCKQEGGFNLVNVCQLI